MIGTHATRCWTCGQSFLTGDCIPAECPRCEMRRFRDSVEPEHPYCTLTGIDDSIPLDYLWSLAREYPFVEWGILYSHNNAGSGRYMSLSRIDELAKRMLHCSPPNFALHICGRAVREFLDPAHTDVKRVAGAFGRVQLNFRYQPEDLDMIRIAIASRAAQNVITQHNAANAPLWRSLSDLSNHAVLFDQSGGRGQTPAEWPEPLDITRERLPFGASNPVCGYAGGLGPDNLSEMLPRIHAAAGNKPYWIDMESKLRDHADRFDLSKARRCLEIAHAFRVQLDQHRQATDVA